MLHHSRIDIMVQGLYGAMVQGCNGAMVQRCNGTTVQWCNGSMVQRFNGTSVIEEVVKQICQRDGLKIEIPESVNNVTYYSKCVTMLRYLFHTFISGKL
jgi:hypothetical protein